MDRSSETTGAPGGTAAAGEARAPLWRVLGIVLFVGVLLAAYYVFHKPLPPASFAPLLGAALDLLAAGGVLASGLALGRWLMDRLLTRGGLDAAQIGRAARLSLSGLVGLALLSAIALGLGLAGLFRGPALWLLVLGPLLVFWRSLRSSVADLRAMAHAARPDTRFGAFLCAFVAIELGLVALMALTPPVTWDALTYHLVEPQRALASGQIAGYDDNFYLGLPKLVEMLFGVAIGLFGRDTAAAPVHFGFGLLGLMAVMGLARRWTGRAESAWLAAALLLGGYSTWALFGYPYVDLAVFAYAAAGFVCALAWERDRKPAWLLAAGLLAGSALGVKYTGAPAALAIGLLVIVRARREALRPLLALAAGVALAYLPWALRGLLLYGNPIYPYAFGGLAWDSRFTAAANQAGRGLLAHGLGWQAPILPLAATVFGGDFEATYFHTSGPWLLTAPFLLAFAWLWIPTPARLAARSALLLLAAPFAIWAVTAATSGVGMQTRLAITVFPLMAALGALAFDALDRAPKKPLQTGFIVKALVAVTMTLALVESIQVVATARPLDALLGFVSPAGYRAERLGPLSEALAQIDGLPDGSRVRFLFEPRGYPCRSGIVCHGDTLFHFWSGGRLAGQPADELFAAWAAGGDSHLLFFRAGYALWTGNGSSYWPELDAELPAALARLGEPLWTSSGGAYVMYRLPSR